MIIDAQARFSWDQAITATAVSTNTYDLGPLGARGLRFNGDDVPFLHILVTESFAAAGAATLTIDFVSDTTANLATPTTRFNLANAVGKATLVAGYVVFSGKLPAIPNSDTEQYIGLNHTVATGPFTSGKLRSFMTPSPDFQVDYPLGYVNY